MVEVNGMLSVIIPAYNESACIFKNIFKTIDELSPFIKEVEIIVVNDGSKDNTESEIDRAMKLDSRVHIVSSEHNHGKGRAIISGISFAKGEYIAFLDADLEIAPDQLQSFFKEMLEKGRDIVIGSKFHKDSDVEYPFKRRVMSMGYYLILLILFRLNIKDTQTGLKLFKKEALKPFAHLIRTSGFAYDIEILAAANRRGYKIAQMPVKVVYAREKGSRRIRIKDIVKAFNDTLAVFYRLNIKKYYD